MKKPQVDDYVKLTFDDNMVSPIYGKVTEVKTDINPATDLDFLVDYGQPNSYAYYTAGVYEGEEYAWVGKTSQINGDTKVGENADFEIVELSDIPDDKIEELMKI